MNNDVYNQLSENLAKNDIELMTVLNHNDTQETRLQVLRKLAQAHFGALIYAALADHRDWIDLPNNMDFDNPALLDIHYPDNLANDSKTRVQLAGLVALKSLANTLTADQQHVLFQNELNTLLDRLQSSGIATNVEVETNWTHVEFKKQ